MALVFTIFLGLLSVVSSISDTCDANTDQNMQLVVEEMKSKGYGVEVGWIAWHHNVTDYGCNPQLTYGQFHFIRHIMDINQVEDLLGVGIGTPRQHQDFDQLWLQYASTGFLWNGCIAPSDYFSVRSYLNRRFNPTVPCKQCKLPMTDPYGSLGNMINKRILNYTITDHTHYNTTTLISSSDNQTYSDIRASLLKFNMSTPDTINFDIMPYKYAYGTIYNGSTIAPYTETVNYKKLDWKSQIINHEPIDSFNMMLRSGEPYFNDSDMMTYFNLNQTVYKFYHIDSINQSVPRQPLPPFVVDMDTAATTNEFEILQPDFDNYVHAVINYVVNEFNSPINGLGWRYRGTAVSQSMFEGEMGYGFKCIKYGIRCMADNRDCVYSLTYPATFYAQNETLQLIVGVIHQDMDNCEWENIEPYYEYDGIFNIISHGLSFQTNRTVLDVKQYKNSSFVFPPRDYTRNIVKDDNVLDKFFIVPVMRENVYNQYPFFKENGNLTSWSNWVWGLDKLDYDNDYFIARRMYLNPTTHTMSDINRFIPFVVINFEQYDF